MFNRSATHEIPDSPARAAELGGQLPEIWADPATAQAHRKALLRCLIDKVVLTRLGRDRAGVRIVWRGGAVTPLEVDLPVNALAALPRAAEMEARVLALARSGLRDDEIVHVLAAEGHRSPRQAAGVHVSTVQGIRLQHGIKAAWRCTRWPPVPGWLTAKDTAVRLGIPEAWLRRKLQAGAVKTRRDDGGRYLFPDQADALQALLQLRAGTLNQAVFTPGVSEQKGHQDA